MRMTIQREPETGTDRSTKQLGNENQENAPPGERQKDTQEFTTHLQTQYEHEHTLNNIRKQEQLNEAYIQQKLQTNKEQKPP